MTHHYPGILIVLEGIDGTGKSTQCKLLAEALRKQHYTVHQSQEPTQGKYGKLLRESQSLSSARYSAEEELELFCKDRKEHVETLIQPALERGEIVILDRYYFSTMAYQGQRGIKLQDIRAMNEAFAPLPDILFIMDLPVEESLKRISKRGDEPNAFEKKEALQFCSDVYLSLKDEPFAQTIDCNQSILEVHQELLKSVLYDLTC